MFGEGGNITHVLLVTVAASEITDFDFCKLQTLKSDQISSDLFEFLFCIDSIKASEPAVLPGYCSRKLLQKVLSRKGAYLSSIPVSHRGEDLPNQGCISPVL